MKRLLSFGIRLLLSLLALYLVLSRVDLNHVMEMISRTDPLIYASALIAVFLGLVITGVRWYVFLKPRTIGVGEAVFVTLGATFYGMFLPAGAGIDVIRGLYAGGPMGSKSKSFASVFMDRMVGFLALLLLALGALLLGSDTMRRIGFYLWVGLVFSLVGSVVILSKRLRHRLIPFLEGLGPLKRFGNFLAAFDTYRESPMVVIKGVIISVVMQLMLGFGAYLITVSLGLLEFSFDLTMLKVVVYTSVVNLVTMLPVTLGGVGIREGSFVYLIGGMVGREGAVSTSLLYYFSYILASMPGMLLLWVRRPTKGGGSRRGTS